MWNKNAKIHNQEVVVVVMDNVFCGAENLHHVFDLKGCTAGRFVVNPERRIEMTRSASSSKAPHKALATKETLKDGNFDCDLYMSRGDRISILRQLQCDCHFLRESNIMDYSLLLGVCPGNNDMDVKRKEKKDESEMIRRLNVLLREEEEEAERRMDIDIDVHTDDFQSYSKIRSILIEEFGSKMFESEKDRVRQILKRRALGMTFSYLLHIIFIFRIFSKLRAPHEIYILHAFESFLPFQ